MSTIILCLLLCGGILYYGRYTRKKQEKQFNETYAAIVPGSKIMTIGGLRGTVREIDENYMILDVSPDETGSVIKLKKSAFYQVIG